MTAATDSISQLLASYVRFRTAVLRQMNFEYMISAEFHRVSGVPPSSMRKRLLDPGLWSPADIHLFARKLRLWDGENHRLAGLAECIEQLPGEERTRLLRAMNLPASQLAGRLASPMTWRAAEIAKLLACLNKKH